MAKKLARRRAKPAAKTAARRAPKRRQPKAEPQSFALVVRDPSGILPQAAPLPTAMAPWALGQEPTLTIEHIATFKLTKGQTAALRRPVKDTEIDWKPTRKDGPPEIPYLSHNGYRDRLDEAFGLGGWGMAPNVAPKEKDGIVYCQWALVVDGKPRCYAWGEQAYHATNKQMTYGDALEGTKSNAIVRCGKELGIARELWDRRFIAGLKRRVPVKDRQIFVDSDRDQPREERQPASARTGNENETISQPQYGRMRGIMKTANRTKDEVLAYLKDHYGVTQARDIKRKDYDAICTAIEKRGTLPLKEQAREADEILPPLTDSDIHFGLEP